MFQSLSLRSKYGPYLANEQGIRKFAEFALGNLIRRVTRKSRVDREKNETLLVEKANKRLLAAELEEQPRLEAGAFFSVRRRLWAGQAFIVAAIVASVILAFVSINAFLAQTSAAPGALRWVVAAVFAAVLTGGGLLVTERFVEATLTPRPPEGDARPETVTAPSVPPGARVLWGFLLVGIELAILGLSEVQAGLFLRQTGSWPLYVGFMALGVLLPVVAGAIRWDGMRYVDIYKTTLTFRLNEEDLARIDSSLRQSEEFESGFYKVQLIDQWNELNAFRTVKENTNARKGVQESLAGHFAQSFDLFQAEATRRYEADVRDFTATSLRRLDVADGQAAVGQKLGQPTASGAGPDGSSYLTPKPVR